MKELLNILVDKGLTIGSVESLTGGLFASTFVSSSGASKAFVGGIVTYSNQAKMDLVGVKKETLEQYGAISKETASEMAKGGQEKLKCDVVVSFTGNAGPEVMENKEVGLVYVGLMVKNRLEVVELRLSGNREEIRMASVLLARDYLIEILKS